MGGDEQHPREELPLGEGWGARWSLEEGAGVFHFRWLLLGLRAKSPGPSREAPAVPSCLAEQVGVLCLCRVWAWWIPVEALPHSFPLGRIKLLWQLCHPNAFEWGRARGPVLQGSNRCK